jgi:hypothetical protein
VKLAWSTILLVGTLAAAQSRPQLPCGQEVFPAYPALGTPPVVTYWNPSDEGSSWTPPACTGWTGGSYSTLVTTVGRFRGSASVEDLLQRIGAISQMAGMRYWSTTHQRWQTLIEEAHAVTGLAGSRARGDFSPDELKPGAVMFFEQLDNLAGKAVYRMHISEVSENRIVVDVENVTTLKYLFLTLFRPGELQTIYFLDRDAPDVWRYYSVVRTGKNASGLTTGKQASSINRAVAFFRHIAGLPGDLEPPAAR